MMKTKDRCQEDGQATVEIALLIPVIVLFVFLILHIVIIIRQQLLVVNASRLAARELSVNSDQSVARVLVKNSIPTAQLTINRPSKQGEYLVVEVKDKVESSIPIISKVIPEVSVSSRTTMRVEK